MKQILKPCPFCGGEAFIEDLVVSGERSVGCFECNVLFNYFDTEEEAIKAWNHRAEKEAP